MKRSGFATHFSVGFVLFVATLLAIGCLFWVGSGDGIFEPKTRFVVHCPSTSGLKIGSKVYLSGVPVGRVRRIDFENDLSISDVRVTLSVRENVVPRIRRDSRVDLKSEGLLGDVSVHISAGTTDVEQLPEGEEIQFEKTTLLGSMVGAEITGNATEIMRELVLILRTIKKGEGSVGKLLREPELYENLATFTKSLDVLAGTLNTVAEDIKSIVGEVEQQKGALGKLIFSKEYEKKIGGALEESAKLIGTLERIAAKVETRKSIAMMFLTDEDLGKRFASMVGRMERSAGSLETILAMIERGEGSLGVLVHDPSIVRSLRDVFLGVQELGYMSNVIRNAEAKGREVTSREDRATQIQRLEAARARFLANVPLVDDSGARLVPASSKSDSKKDDGDEHPDSRSRDDAE